MNPFTNPLVASILGGWVRHGLGGLGAVLGVEGLSADNNVNLVTGFGLFALSLTWSAVQKYLEKSKPSS